MKYQKRWSKKRRMTLLYSRNRSRYTQVHQSLLNLNLFKKLSAFNTRKYDPEDYFAVFEHASLHQISIKQACLMERLQGRKCPSPEQVMKCCRETSPEMTTLFINSALKAQFNALPKKIQQHLKKSASLIIDFHQDCYYGKKDNPYIRKSKTKKSTNIFYEYLTADFYCTNGCFTIALFHRTPGESIISLTKRLLNYVEKVISVKVVIFDGEFATVEVLNLLLCKNLKFLGRKSRTRRVKEHLNTYYGSPDWEKNRKWRLIELCSKKPKRKTVSVEICPQNVHNVMKTLVKSPGWSITPKYADKLYKRRFNIETGYRDKHKFQLFTCTKILSTRLLSFLIAVLLWNCWQSFLIWVRSLKSYSQNLPRGFLVQITVNWVKMYIKNTLYIR